MRHLTQHAGPRSAGAVQPPVSSASFVWPLRVYWEDTDAGGVVFYANYLRFFERARTEWLRALGVSQQVLREQESTLFVVSDTQVQYLQPARLDDALTITVQLLERGRASLLIAQEALRGDTLLARGRIRIGCVDAGNFRPRRIPNPVLDILPIP